MKYKVIYGAAVNLSGVWGPMKMTASKYDIGGYWDRTGDFSIDKLGERHFQNIITFASPDRAKTAAWVKGVKASMEMLSNWCK